MEILKPGVAVLLALCNCVFATSYLPPEKMKIESEDGSHRFDLFPGEVGTVRECRGKLTGNGKVLWKGSLINNEAPDRVFVANKVGWVVTQGEWMDPDLFAVVIYTGRGQVRMSYDLASLGLKRRSNWLKNSLSFFDEECRHFIIRANTGAIIVVDLFANWILDESYKQRRPELVEYARRRSREIALEGLRSTSAVDRELGALIAGQEALIEAIPLLEKCLLDPTFHSVTAGSNPPQKVLSGSRASHLGSGGNTQGDRVGARAAASGRMRRRPLHAKQPAAFHRFLPVGNLHSTDVRDGISTSSTGNPANACW